MLCGNDPETRPTHVFNVHPTRHSRIALKHLNVASEQSFSILKNRLDFEIDDSISKL